MSDTYYWNCPHCGAELKEGAKVCHNCGSDEETGWSDQCYLDGADWIHEEWEPEKKEKESKHSAVVIILIVFVLIGLVLSTLR